MRDIERPVVPPRLALLGYSPEDAARVKATVIERSLAEDPFEVDGPALLERLHRHGLDVLLVDDKTGGYSAELALKLLTDLGSEVPVVVWAENLSETRAGALLRAGASEALCWAQKDRLAPRVTALWREGRARSMRRNTEAALAGAAECQKALMASAPVVLFGVRKTDLTRTWTRGDVEGLTGFPAERFLDDGEFWFSRLHPDSREAVRLARLSFKERDSLGFEFQWMHADGQYRWFFERIFDCRKPGKGETVGTWLDITAAKLLEAEFLQAQKMEPLGRLAGGVVHDLNNLLMVVMGSCEILTEQDVPADWRPELEQISQCAERAGKLVTRLLSFSRRPAEPPQLVDPNPLIRDLQKMLSRLIGDDIRLVTALEPDPGFIRVDAGQLEQVLLNLAVNARDAMPKGGQLTVETGRVPAMPGGSANDIPAVVISVRDTGMGMDGEVKRRLFEPFFTTKPRGRGTGLGLATVRQLVESAGGRVLVESHVGLGTSVMLCFPAAGVSSTAGTPAPESAETSLEGLEGRETILLVEDEESVRSLAHRLLSRLGYDVLVAKEPGEALLMAEASQRPIKLLLSDLVMPQMRGSQLAERVKKMRPEVKVLLMSAHHENEPERLDPATLAHPLLAKPFRPYDLARGVRRVLDGPPRAESPGEDPVLKKAV